MRRQKVDQKTLPAPRRTQHERVPDVLHVQWFAAAPLDRLGLPPEERDDLAKLGVTTLGDFLALPAGGLRERFDEPVARVHNLASGAVWTPLQPVSPTERLVARIDLEFADGVQCDVNCRAGSETNRCLAGTRRAGHGDRTRA